jgi:sugar lactone lactonase YvrE
MTLEQLGAGIDFVSDTTPTNATDGDTFLDTSLSPPQVKVFDASIGAFVRPQTTQNLDQQVSNAGADLRFRGGFQLSLAEFVLSFDVSGQDSTPNDVAFSADGTTMLVLGRSNGFVFQYALSSGFDLSTASFTGSSFDVSGQAGRPQGFAFNENGTTMFVIGRGSDSVFQYALSTGFDVSTASFTGSSFDVSGQDTRPHDVAFSADGTTMLVVGNNNDSVFQYALSTGFDISTASFTGISFDVSAQARSAQGVTFNADGTTMFVAGRGTGSLFQYALSTGFDVSTASFTGSSFDVSGQGTNPRGITFNADGTTMVVIGKSSDSAHQYLVGTVAPK